MKKLTELGVFEYQQVSQSKSYSRVIKPSYFKIRKDSNTVLRLKTRIVELKGGRIRHP